jgi:dephospho-CoA kinase
MLKVGLTGNIGSGKTFIARVFQSLGVPVFYADIEAKALYKQREVKEKIRILFGSQVFDYTGEIDRKALAGIIFNEPDHLLKINALIHPLVHQEFNNWLAGILHKPYAIYEAAILFETGHHQNLDKVILVTAPEELRIKRVMDRDGIPRNEVLSRMANQWEEDKKISLADFVIRNDGSKMVIPQVMRVHAELAAIGQINGRQSL